MIDIYFNNNITHLITLTTTAFMSRSISEDVDNMRGVSSATTIMRAAWKSHLGNGVSNERRRCRAMYPAQVQSDAAMSIGVERPSWFGYFPLYARDDGGLIALPLYRVESSTSPGHG